MRGRQIEVEIRPALGEGACETSGDTIAPVRRVVEFEVGRIIDTELFVHRGCCGVECVREGWSCGTIYGLCSPDDQTPLDCALSGPMTDYPELCNGRDDNCDDAVDNDIPEITYGRGVCSCTVPGCVDGEIPVCEVGSPDFSLCGTGVDADIATVSWKRVHELRFISTTTGDGYGAGEGIVRCGVGDYVTLDGDCDNADPNIFPGQIETCDEIDNDCDVDVDEGVMTRYYGDADGDRYVGEGQFYRRL